MDPLATMAAQAHADTSERKPNGSPSDKKTAARDGVNRSTANRRRRYGAGSPLKPALDWIATLPPAEAMRAAATVLCAARMNALGGKETPELIALYWKCRASEATHEGEDRALDSTPPTSWEWSRMANATARDWSTDLTKEALERIFDARGVEPAEVWRTAPGGR